MAPEEEGASGGVGRSEPPLPKDGGGLEKNNEDAAKDQDADFWMKAVPRRR
jgi:hypothetical protein